MLSVFGVSILAANSSGSPRVDTGYVPHGTGDPAGMLPSRYFSTSSDDSLDDMLALCDVLVCALPSTPRTRGLLDAHRLSRLRPDAVLVNVGRGDLISSGAPPGSSRTFG